MKSNNGDGAPAREVGGDAGGDQGAGGYAEEVAGGVRRGQFNLFVSAKETTTGR